MEGFSFKNVPILTFKKKFLTTLLFGKHAHGKNSPTKKKYLLINVPSLDINLSNSNKNYLSISFESRKFIIEYDALQSFENQINP